MVQFPDVSVSAVGGYLGQPTIFTRGLSGTVHPDFPKWLQEYSVTVTQPLYTGGKIKHNIEKSALEKQIAGLNLEKDKADVKLSLMSKYLDLFRLYKQKEVLMHHINDAEQRLHDIRKMKDEGMLTLNDVLRSEIQLTNYQLTIRETDDDISIVSRQLDVALGLDEDLLLMPDTTLLEEAYPILSYEEYVARAYRLYPELRIAQSEIDLAKKNVQLLKGDYLPSVFLQAGNTLERPITNVDPPLDMFLNSWNISLVFSYKFSSFYKNRPNVSAAKRAVLMHKTMEEKQLQDIRVNVKAAFVKHREALDRIELLTGSVRQANENFRIVQNRYFNQLAVLTDLLDAGNVKLDAELQLTAAKAGAVYTYYQLLRLSGGL
jgi:outer membrane protein TolC